MRWRRQCKSLQPAIIYGNGRGEYAISGAALQEALQRAGVFESAFSRQAPRLSAPRWTAGACAAALAGIHSPMGQLPDPAFGSLFEFADEPLRMGDSFS